MNLPAGLDTRLAKGGEETLAVFNIQKDGLAAISAIHHMINRACVFHAQLASHVLTLRQRVCKVKNRPLYGHVTSWAYDAYGHMVGKTDGNNVLVSTNGYDAGGRLTAHWTPAKGLTHYTYDADANPLSVAYSSGPGITATYDGLNRIVSLNDAVGASAFTYANFGAFKSALATEDGPWSADTVTHGYANRLPVSLSLAQPSGSWTNGFAYDSLLRLAGVASPAGSFGYTYYGAGREIQTLSLPGGNSIAKTYDDAGRLLSTALKHSTTNLDSYGYAYDANGNRTSVLRADGAQVTYGYDNIGELTSAVGVEPDGTTVRGNENFGYGYDPAGNLAMRTNNTLEQTFGTDNANQLVNILRNDSLTFGGSLTNLPTSLTINGQPATIYGDLTFAVNNGVALNDGLNQFTAVVTSGLTMTNVFQKTLPSSVNLAYDLNGNLVSDGLHGYDYDCANELVQITVTNQWQTRFAYDGFGRRRVKQEYNWVGGTWVQASEVHYVYDGMNVIQERDANNNPLVSYTRGVDLSGSMQGAGGIGGLLARTDAGGSAFYHGDGNGNITMLINSSGSQLAKYLYDSFGNLIDKRGPLADANTYRFSSKEVDLRSGLYNFGYRYYEPNLQRWPNRDPIQEAGGLNLYGYVGNNPVNYFDPYGLAMWIGSGTTLLGLHQTFNIGNPQGTYVSYSFGLPHDYDVLFPWVPGQVSSEQPTAAPNIQYQYGFLNTTPEEDANGVNVMNQLVGDQYRYSLFGSTCRTFSQDMFNVFATANPDRYIPPPPPPPVAPSYQSSPSYLYGL